MVNRIYTSFVYSVKCINLITFLTPLLTMTSGVFRSLDQDLLLVHGKCGFLQRFGAPKLDSPLIRSEEISLLLL